MARCSLLLFTVGLGLFLPACGGDVGEEAQTAGTAAAIAQAPPNAVGYDVDRPPPPLMPPKVPATTPPHKPLPKHHTDLEHPDTPPPVPTAAPTVAPKKGTDL